MSRKTTAGLWLFLLLLLGVPLRAQTLEYWFDDNFEQRSSVSIATDADQELSLNLKSNTLFPMGCHVLRRAQNRRGTNLETRILVRR